MITGTITNAENSRSGKTLRVEIDNSRWYSTKEWELQNAINQQITFQPSSTEYQGSTINWINDYQIGAIPTTADQAFNQAYQNPPQPPMPPMPQQPMQPPMPNAGAQYAATQGARPAVTPPPTEHKNRDASIVAQTLTKICSSPGDDPVAVWERYTSFYALYLQWDGRPEQPAPMEHKSEPVGTTIPGGATGDGQFDDDIPF